MHIMKIDKRAKELARIVVEYSTKVKKGDLVKIAGQPIALKFIEEIAKRVIDKGATPILAVASPTIVRYMVDNGSLEQICHLPEFVIARAKEVDVNITVSAQENPLYMQGADSKKMAKGAVAMKPIQDIIIGDGKDNPGKRWCVVGFPTMGNAVQGGMNLAQWEDALYKATNIDWKKTSKRLNKIKNLFDGAKDVHIYVPGKTDLHLSLEGRGGQVCDGKCNMPDGEVFYGPVEDSAQGYITFSYPAIRSGNEVAGIRLEYKDGKLAKFSAKKGEKFLADQLAIEGADRIGELGIGGNPGVTRYMKNLLFDEKIDGTIHLAVGMSYPEPLKEGGGLNKSALHWDLVCELRKINQEPGGQIYVDNKLVQENGVWCFEKKH
jgi:aminopeptidase